MERKVLTVTNSDLEQFRRFMRFMFVENVKSILDEKLERSELIKTTLHDLDTHFLLEEPLVTTQIGMWLSGADDANVIVNENIFTAYKALAFFDIKGNYKPVSKNDEDEKLVVDTALQIQKRLVEVLDAAVSADEFEQTRSNPNPNPQSKQYLN